MTEHYFSKKQESPFRPSKVMFKVLKQEVEFYTAGGVFSPKNLDKGTRLMIENAELKSGQKILDLGCGYGVLGIMLKRKNPNIEMWMSDVNQRSIKLTRMNLKLYDLDVQTISSDGFENKRFNGIMFDKIYLNPPQSAGKEVCFKLFKESLEHLVPEGILQIVARTKKGGKQLSAEMNRLFGNVTEGAKGSGFRLYMSVKT